MHWLAACTGSWAMRDLRARSLKKACFIAALFSMMLLAAPAFAQTVTAMWDPSPASDQVNGYQVCVGTSSLSCNVGLVSVGASTTAFTFAPTGGVRYYLAIRAQNAAGSSAYSSEVTFSVPSFTQPGNQAGVAGLSMSPLTLLINDPDGSPLTITHTGLPVGLSINSATRQITGTPAAAGTYNVTLFVNDGLVTVPRSFVWTVSNAPSGQWCWSNKDINGDCRADLLWRNSATGDIVAWYLNGTTVIGTGTFPRVSDPNWQLMSTADVNRDGLLDLIWRNSATGQNVVWYLSGTAVIGTGTFPNSDPAWQLAATVDINRDGSPDFVWRNSVTGQNAVWYLSGTTFLGYANLPTVADLAWQLTASADINRDGAPDLIWRNTANGQNLVWYLNGGTVVGSASFPTVADQAWKLVAAMDLDNDGTIELIWRNSTAGTNSVWYLNQTTYIRAASLPTVADQSWKISGR